MRSADLIQRPIVKLLGNKQQIIITSLVIVFRGTAATWNITSHNIYVLQVRVTVCCYMLTADCLEACCVVWDFLDFSSITSNLLSRNNDSCSVWRMLPQLCKTVLDMLLLYSVCETNRGAHPVQSVLVDGVAEPHLAVQWMSLVVADKVDEALELCWTAQHEETAFLLDATVFDLPLRPTDRERKSAAKRKRWSRKPMSWCCHAIVLSAPWFVYLKEMA